MLAQRAGQLGRVYFDLGDKFLQLIGFVRRLLQMRQGAYQQFLHEPG